MERLEGACAGPAARRSSEVSTIEGECRVTTSVRQVTQIGLLCLIFADTKDGEEGLLWNIDLADALHPLLAFLLLFQELSLAGNVAAVALGEHILAQGGDRFAGHDLCPDGGLDGDFELLPGDEFAHFGNQQLAALVS